MLFEFANGNRGRRHDKTVVLVPIVKEIKAVAAIVELDVLKDRAHKAVECVYWH
jgi:hypothetical protein